ncbi:MAG TPA: hypothetical protein VGQ00_04735, partial [Candidatus Norongarragalinales archaeon]|nr:hypothetical protein [Candidatus Norongarragalinales archaeon]
MAVGPKAPRYGVTIRKRLAAVLKQQQGKYACPNCGKKTLKRESNAIWKCKSCGFKMAGGAYSPETSVGAT